MRVWIKAFSFICLLSAVQHSLQAQIKRIKLHEQKIGPVNLIYQKSIDLDKGDTLYMIYMGFQNYRYSSITDIKSIALYDAVMVAEFIKDLVAVNKQMQTGEKVSMSWSRKEYELELREFTKDCSLGDPDGLGYTYINLKNVGKLLTSVSRIKFGEDLLLPEEK